MWIAVTLFLVGAAADWYTTKRRVIDKRDASELNPLLRWLIGKPDPGDEWRIAGGKLFGTVLLLWGCYATDTPLAPPLATLGVIQLLVAASNKWGWLRVLLRRLK